MLNRFSLMKIFGVIERLRLHSALLDSVKWSAAREMHPILSADWL